MASKQAQVAVASGVRSERGRRDENQDKMSAFSTPMGLFYVVADGMGGHRGGAEASRRVVDGYQQHLNAFYDATSLVEALQKATTLTNEGIIAAGNSGDPSIAGMGSTVVMALLQSGNDRMQLTTAHIGDSRAYLLRDGVLRRLTRDHSMVQRMVDENLITPEMARTHPDLNVLTRAIGKQPTVEIEVGESTAIYLGDTVMLCTDGLWGHLSDEQIIRELSVDRTAQETSEALAQLALDAGSDDNITVQVIRLEDARRPGRVYRTSGAAGRQGGPAPLSRPAQAPYLPGDPVAAHSGFGPFLRGKRPLSHYAIAAACCLLLATAAAFCAVRVPGLKKIVVDLLHLKTSSTPRDPAPINQVVSPHSAIRNDPVDLKPGLTPSPASGAANATDSNLPSARAVPASPTMMPFVNHGRTKSGTPNTHQAGAPLNKNDKTCEVVGVSSPLINAGIRGEFCNQGSGGSAESPPAPAKPPAAEGSSGGTGGSPVQKHLRHRRSPMER